MRRWITNAASRLAMGPAISPISPSPTTSYDLLEAHPKILFDNDKLVSDS